MCQIAWLQLNTWALRWRLPGKCGCPWCLQDPDGFAAYGVCGPDEDNWLAIVAHVQVVMDASQLGSILCDLGNGGRIDDVSIRSRGYYENRIRLCLISLNKDYAAFRHNVLIFIAL